MNRKVGKFGVMEPFRKEFNVYYERNGKIGNIKVLANDAETAEDAVKEMLAYDVDFVQASEVKE